MSETLQEYRARKLEAEMRRRLPELRREFWEMKAAQAVEERRDLATRPWVAPLPARR